MSTAPPSEPRPAPSTVEASWAEFANAGLFWWVNRGLHLFGWVLVQEVVPGPDGDTILRVYPARCRYRGFPEDTEDEGFKKLTQHLKDNVEVLVQQTSE